jgi:magnesium-protoporphyrin IX monomethyl ester (oxidative) cyclase
MQALSSRYGVKALYASDNVMAPDFPRTVLPRLISSDYTLFYEVKSGFKDRDLDLLVRAGVVEIQPGIESLATPVLDLMSKGVTALDNIRTLRDCRSRGLEVIWNFLTGIPGEKREYYERVLRLIPYLEHLRAPTRWGPLRISRYSPYYREPEKYGISNVRPWYSLQLLFGESAAGLAQHFNGDYETELLTDPDLVERLYSALWRWAASWGGPNPSPILAGFRLPDGSMIVEDRRSVAHRPQIPLSPEEVRLLDLASRAIPAASLDPTSAALMQNLIARGLIVACDGALLSIVTEPAIGERLRQMRLSDVSFQEQAV